MQPRTVRNEGSPFWVKFTSKPRLEDSFNKPHFSIPGTRKLFSLLSQE